MGLPITFNPSDQKIYGLAGLLLGSIALDAPQDLVHHVVEHWCDPRKITLVVIGIGLEAIARQLEVKCHEFLYRFGDHHQWSSLFKE